MECTDEVELNENQTYRLRFGYPETNIQIGTLTIRYWFLKNN